MDGRYKIMRTAVVLFIVLALPSGVFAQYSSLEYVQVPAGSISRVDTQVEAKIENWGLERVFVGLPAGWNVSETALLDGSHSFGGTAYPLRLYVTHYWHLWGGPNDRSGLLGSGQVYDSKETKDVVFTKVAGRQGWYLKPNEGIKITFGVEDIGASGIVDPLKIEKENPNIRVVRWYQNFLLQVAEPGFITAPWIVEGATLTEAAPAPYSDVSDRSNTRYYPDFEIKKDVKKWDAWFEGGSTLSSLLVSRSLAPTKLQFQGMWKSETLRPVFKIKDYRLISYAYEWERDVKIEGITLWRNDFVDVPDWFDWF